MKPLIELMAVKSVCPQTVAGWLWYCDEHDTHGNADSWEEANACSETHSKFMGRGAGCTVIVWQRP